MSGLDGLGWPINDDSPEAGGDCPSAPRSPSDSALDDSIRKRQRAETEYWLAEWMDGCEARNVSIHRLHCAWMEYTIVFNMDDKASVLIETNLSATTAGESHKYMMLGERVLEKLAALFHLSNAGGS